MCDVITGHPAIDNWLKFYEPNLSARNYAKFCKIFTDLVADEQQLRHKLRELILGGFLAKHGYEVEYERRYGDLEPDWTISKDSKIAAILEVTNFHGKIETENEIRKTMGSNQWVFAYLSSCGDKVWSALEVKFSKYKSLSNELDVPYIVGLAIEFVAAGMIEPKDVLDAVHNENYGLFKAHPEVSGLYHFADSDGYIMRYEPNPHALRPLPRMPQGHPLIV
jgi:hypothetical protein